MESLTRIRKELLNWYPPLLNAINKIPTFLFVLIIITGNFITKRLTGNEEHYLALAKQFYDSTWLPSSFLFNDWPGERLLFQYFAGFLLHFLSFEKMALVGKFIAFLLISYPLALLFKKVNLSNLSFFFLFQFVFVFYQGFFAGEWMIGGFEPKTLAYPFIILAFVYVIDNKWYKAILIISIATYFHFLLGGWFLLVMLIYHLLTYKNFKNLLIIAVLYGILILPFLIYIINGTSHIPQEINGLKYDYLITYIGNSLHTAIFSSVHNFFQYRLLGVLVLMAVWLVSCIFFSKISNEKLKKLNNINIIIIGLIFIFVIISIFDKSGFFLKFLPFRTETIALLFFLIIASGYIYEKLNVSKIRFQIFAIALTFAIPLFLYNSARSLNLSIRYKNNTYNEFYKYVEENTHFDDVFAFTGYRPVYAYGLPSHFDLSFSRKTRRNIFVLFKFIPYSEKIYEWNDRLQEKVMFEQDYSNVWITKKKYKLDYIISMRPIIEEGFILVYNSEDVYLYKLEP